MLSGAVTLALHLLGDLPWTSIEWSDLGRWLEATPPADALLSACRLVGLVCGWWVLISSAVYLSAELRGAARAMGLARPFTLPLVRKLSAGITAGTLAVSTLGTGLPALAAAQSTVVHGEWDTSPDPVANPDTPKAPGPGDRHRTAPPLVAQAAGDPFLFPLPLPHLHRDSTLPDTEGTQTPSMHTETARALDPLPSPPLHPGEEYCIEVGDHLWKIAEKVLSRASDRLPTTAEVADYWTELIGTNHLRLRSATPDLIYPGEKIILPEVPTA